MELIGTVESLWRYPVKSMRGEELQEAFVGFPGVFGDRLYAFRNSGAPKGLSLSDGSGTGNDAAVSTALPKSGTHDKARQSCRG